MGLKEKDAYWFHHDANARHDPRLVQLKMRHGMAGVGIWWNIVELLRESADYRLPWNEATFGTIAYEGLTNPEDAETLVEYCVELGLLVREDDTLASPSLCRRMERWESSKQAKSERAAAAAEKRWAESRSNANAMPNDADAMREHSTSIYEDAETPQNAGNADAMQMQCDSMQIDARRGEERRGEEKRLEAKRGGDSVDPVLTSYRKGIEARLPATAWPDTGKQIAALRELASKTRELAPTTAVGDPVRFAEIALEIFSEKKAGGRGEYWSGAAWEPVVILRRFGEIVTTMSDRWESQTEQQAALARTEEFLNAAR